MSEDVSTDSWQHRLSIERRELAEKLTHLHEYIRGDVVKQLPTDYVELLTEQVSAMAQYLGVLDRRIMLIDQGLSPRFG